MTNLDSFLIHLGLLEPADYVLILISLGLISLFAIGTLPIVKRIYSIGYNLFYKWITNHQNVYDRLVQKEKGVTKMEVDRNPFICSSLWNDPYNCDGR